MPTDNKGRVWSTAKKVVLDDSQLEAIHTDGSVVLRAGPGAGKTETLSQRVVHAMATRDCPPGRRILALTFKKDAARNLENRVKQRLRKSDLARFESLTMDAFTKGIVDRNRHALPDDLAFKNYAVSFASSKAFELSAIHRESPTFQDWKKALKAPKPQVTFTMMSRIASHILVTNPALRALYHSAYSHILVDELQDTTQHQLDFLMELAGPETTVIAVGDPDQRIMGFAKALDDAFESFSQAFTATTKELLYNHRAEPSLAALQAHVRQGLFSGTTSVKASAAGADCTVVVAGHEAEEAQAVAAFIAGIPAETKARSVCVLYRKAGHVEPTAIVAALATLGIAARVEDKMQDVLSEPYTALVLDALAVGGQGPRPEAYERLRWALQSVIGIDSPRGTRTPVEDFLRELENIGTDFEATTAWVEVFLAHFDATFTQTRLASLYPHYQAEDWLQKKRDETRNMLSLAAVQRNSAGELAAHLLGEGFVPVMTLHKSKGLEFDHVILVGFEDAAFTSNDEVFKGDERRACFVGFTRARRSILVTQCVRRKNAATSVANMQDFYATLAKNGILPHAAAEFTSKLREA